MDTTLVCEIYGVYNINTFSSNIIFRRNCSGTFSLTSTKIPPVLHQSFFEFLQDFQNNVLTVTFEGHARAQDPGIAIMRKHKKRYIF
jgi:hypothetical protein